MKIFLSHSSQDKQLVDDLRRALELRGSQGWLDAWEMRGGDMLSKELKRAIDASDAFTLFVSPASLQSKWVGEELHYALQVQRRRKKAEIAYPVVPLCIDGTKLGVFGADLQWRTDFRQSQLPSGRRRGSHPQD